MDLSNRFDEFATFDRLNEKIPASTVSGQLAKVRVLINQVYLNKLSGEREDTMSSIQKRYSSTLPLFSFSGSTPIRSDPLVIYSLSTSSPRLTPSLKILQSVAIPDSFVPSPDLISEPPYTRQLARPMTRISLAPIA